MSYFSSKSFPIAPPPLAAAAAARTLPLSTCHRVTLAFEPPSRLPWLVVVSALVAPFSSRRCLSTRSLHLLPPICLSFSPAGCCVTSHCAASPNVASRCTATSHRRAGWLLCVVPPPPRVSSPHVTAFRNAPAGCPVASHHATLSFARVRDDRQCPGAVVHSDAAAVVS
jgi:hypothetical protein